MLSLYGTIPLQHFVHAAEHSLSDTHPIHMGRGRRWRERSVRVLNFLTLRPFRGEKWQNYKQNALKKAFRHALTHHHRHKNGSSYCPPDFLETDSPLTRFEIIRSIQPIDAELSQRISLAAVKKGVVNAAYDHNERQYKPAIKIFIDEQDTPK